MFTFKTGMSILVKVTRIGEFVELKAFQRKCCLIVTLKETFAVDFKYIVKTETKTGTWFG